MVQADLLNESICNSSLLTSRVAAGIIVNTTVNTDLIS